MEAELEDWQVRLCLLQPEAVSPRAETVPDPWQWPVNMYAISIYRVTHHAALGTSSTAGTKQSLCLGC